jgi:hypothetical protein
MGRVRAFGIVGSNAASGCGRYARSVDLEAAIAAYVDHPDDFAYLESILESSPQFSIASPPDLEHASRPSATFARAPSPRRAFHTFEAEAREWYDSAMRWVVGIALLGVLAKATLGCGGSEAPDRAAAMADSGIDDAGVADGQPTADREPLDASHVGDCAEGRGVLCWVKHAGGDAGTGAFFSVPENAASGVAILSDGSIVATGGFLATATFGRGESGETTLTSTGLDTADMFVARYWPDGSLVWAKQAGGISGDSGTAVVALSDDAMIVLGEFTASATFGAGQKTPTVLTGSGSFLAKYAIDGSLVWAKRVAAIGAAPIAMAVLPDDGVVVTGYYGFEGDPATFGPGDPNQTILSAYGLHGDIFIARYQADGSIAWAKRAGGPDSDVGTGVAVSSGEVVVTGTFESTASFGEGDPTQTKLEAPPPTSADPSPHNGVFVAKYAIDGSLVWARGAVGVADPPGDAVGSAVASKGDGKIVVAGIFGPSVVFGPGEPTETTLTGRGSFVAAYDPSGSFVWAKAIDGTSAPASVDVASDGSLRVTGWFQGSVTFGPGESDSISFRALSAAAGSEYGDIFIARLESNGALAWARREGCGALGTSSSARVAEDGTVVVVGWFEGRSIFGEGEPREATLEPFGLDDMFVAKLSP